MLIEVYKKTPNRIIDFSNCNYTNISDKYVINPSTGAVEGPFGSNVKPLTRIGGKKYIQSISAVTNVQQYSNDFSTNEASAGLTIQNPQISSDPLRGTTACLITETATTDSHRLYYSGSIPAGSAVIAHFVKKYGTANRWIRTQAETTQSWYNLQTNQWDTKDALHRGHFSINVGNSWYFIGFMFDTTGIIYHTLGLSNADGSSSHFLGVVTAGVYVWQRQSHAGNYFKRLINTLAGGGVCNKDQIYLPASLVPNELKDSVKFTLYPEWSSDQVTGGDTRVVCCFAGSTENITVYYNGTDKKIYVDGSVSGNLITSGATTHLANQKLEVTLRRGGFFIGSLTLSGFTTGNGTSFGTNWNRTDGNLYIGQDSTESKQWDGLVGEPEIV